MSGNRRRLRLLFGLMVGAPVVFISNFTFAQSANSWTNTTASGKWETPVNWSLGVAPTNTHGAILITNASTKTVTIDSGTPAANRTISNLTVSAPAAALNTLQITNAGTVTPLRIINAFTIGAGGALTIAGSSLLVSNAGATATLDVRAGTLTFDGGVITADRLLVTNSLGRIFFNAGSLTTRGTTVSNTFAFTVPSGAALNLLAGTHLFNDALIINNGATALITNATVRVQGAQGLSMDGAVSLRAGSTVITTNVGTFIGARSQESAGTLTVNGGTLLGGNLFVGQYSQSQGNVRLLSGAVTLLGNLSAGLGFGAAASTGTLVIAGGQLAVTNGNTILGDNVFVIGGLAQMTVSNGTALLRDVILGKTTGAQGSLTAVGGIVTVYSSLTLGDCATTATGTMLVTGGTVFITNAAHTATLDVRNGTVTVNSGTLAVDKLVVTNVCGRFIHTGGTLITNVLVVTAGFDADGDGIPNSFEDANRLDKFDPSDAGRDADGDGLSNLAEFLAGTSPTNSASAFRITSVVRTNNNIRITWMTAPGKTNALQRTAGATGGSFATNNFAAIFTVTNTVGTVTNYLDVGAATNFPARFYRVRLVQ